MGKNEIIPNKKTQIHLFVKNRTETSAIISEKDSPEAERHGDHRKKHGCGQKKTEYDPSAAGGTDVHGSGTDPGSGNGESGAHGGDAGCPVRHSGRAAGDPPLRAEPGGAAPEHLGNASEAHHHSGAHRTDLALLPDALPGRDPDGDLCSPGVHPVRVSAAGAHRRAASHALYRGADESGGTQ